MTHITFLANSFELRICRSMDTGVASERTSYRAFVGFAAFFATPK